jgi:hypothetical protein
MMAKRKNNISGAHSSPRRILSATEEQWERWSAAARASGLTWAEWCRSLQDAAADKIIDSVVDADIRV